MTSQLTKHTKPNWFLYIWFRKHLWKVREGGKKSWEGLKEEIKCKWKVFLMVADTTWNSSFQSYSWPDRLPTNNPKLHSKYLGLHGKSSDCCYTSKHIFYSAKEPVNACSIGFLHLYPSIQPWTRTIPQSSLHVIQSGFSPLLAGLIYRVYEHILYLSQNCEGSPASQAIKICSKTN